MTGSSDWDDTTDIESDGEIKVIANPNLIKPLPAGSANAEVVSALAEKLLSEVKLVASGDRIDVERARQNAALALQLQIELSTFLSDSEGRARAAKNSAKFTEAMIFSEIRKGSAEGKKMTDAAVKEKGLQDERLATAEKQVVDAEVEYKKWSYVFGTAKDAHIFFRNIANGKNEWTV